MLPVYLIDLGMGWQSCREGKVPDLINGNVHPPFWDIVNGDCYRWVVGVIRAIRTRRKSNGKDHFIHPGVSNNTFSDLSVFLCLGASDFAA